MSVSQGARAEAADFATPAFARGMVSDNLRPVSPEALARRMAQPFVAPAAPQSYPVPARDLPEADQRLAIRLLREGVLAPHALLQALARLSERPGGRIVDIILDGELAEEGALFAALHRFTGIGPADAELLPDPRLIDQIG